MYMLSLAQKEGYISHFISLCAQSDLVSTAVFALKCSSVNKEPTYAWRCPWHARPPWCLCLSVDTPTNSLTHTQKPPCGACPYSPLMQPRVSPVWSGNPGGPKADPDGPPLRVPGGWEKHCGAWRVRAAGRRSVELTDVLGTVGVVILGLRSRKSSPALN